MIPSNQLLQKICYTHSTDLIVCPSFPHPVRSIPRLHPLQPWWHLGEKCLKITVAHALDKRANDSWMGSLNKLDLGKPLKKQWIGISGMVEKWWKYIKIGFVEATSHMQLGYIWAAKKLTSSNVEDNNWCDMARHQALALPDWGPAPRCQSHPGARLPNDSASMPGVNHQGGPWEPKMSWEARWTPWWRNPQKKNGTNIVTWN